MIKAVLAAIPYGDLAHVPNQSTPSMDIRSIFRFAPRLSLAALDVALVQQDGGFVSAAFELTRALHAEAWDGSPAVLRQLEKCVYLWVLLAFIQNITRLTMGYLDWRISVGERYMHTLALAGIGNILEVAKAASSHIESLLGRNPPVCSYLLSPFISLQFAIPIHAKADSVLLLLSSLAQI